ncbi:hypothetical protein [Methanomassiliicoccus luminyensis]|uniref:hypothetical protein n=1 Tax=Methanomassiliicoccus luminyensis TaxID=1080712 RepID=UPI001F472C0E|nr:hypothetical protein [Methanomassiliicoccus luminyensis]
MEDRNPRIYAKCAIAMPFLASRHTQALELCMKSILRYGPESMDIFISVDAKGSVSDIFPKERIQSISDRINIIPLDDKNYKQALLNYMASLDYDYTYVIHSDVFFTGNKALNKLLKALVDKSDAVLSYYDVPLCIHESTYHMSGESKRKYVLSPRVSTWIMCFNVGNYRKIKKKYGMKIDFVRVWMNLNDDYFEEYNQWMRSQKEFDLIYSSFPFDEYMVDIGGLIKYQIDTGNVNGVSVGSESNPDFNSMNLNKRSDEYVHIEQFDPSRYNDRLYSKGLLDTRANQIKDYMKRNYPE